MVKKSVYKTMKEFQKDLDRGARVLHQYGVSESNSKMLVIKADRQIVVRTSQEVSEKMLMVYHSQKEAIMRLSGCEGGVFSFRKTSITVKASYDTGMSLFGYVLAGVIEELKRKNPSKASIIRAMNEELGEITRNALEESGISCREFEGGQVSIDVYYRKGVFRVRVFFQQSSSKKREKYKIIFSLKSPVSLEGFRNRAREFVRTSQDIYKELEAERRQTKIPKYAYKVFFGCRDEELVFRVTRLSANKPAWRARIVSTQVACGADEGVFAFNRLAIDTVSSIFMKKKH